MQDTNESSEHVSRKKTKKAIDDGRPVLIREKGVPRPRFSKHSKEMPYMTRIKILNSVPAGMKRKSGRPRKFFEEEIRQRDDFAFNVGLLRNDRDYYIPKSYVSDSTGFELRKLAIKKTLVQIPDQGVVVGSSSHVASEDEEIEIETDISNDNEASISGQYNHSPIESIYESTTVEADTASMNTDEEITTTRLKTQNEVLNADFEIVKMKMFAEFEQKIHEKEMQMRETAEELQKLHNELQIEKEKVKLPVTTVTEKSIQTGEETFLEYAERINTYEWKKSSYRTGSQEFNYQTEWAEFQILYEKAPKKRFFSRKLKNGCYPMESFTSFMFFLPTKEMMKDLSMFVSFTEWMGAREAGGSLIIPPRGYTANIDRYAKSGDKQFNHPKQQRPERDRNVEGSHSYFLRFHKVFSKKFSIQEFYEFSKTRSRLENPFYGIEDEVAFLKEIEHSVPFYLKDQLGTLFDDPDETLWNLWNLQTSFQKNSGFSTTNENDGAGLTRSYLYLSEAFSAFADHVEDFNAYSLNFMHFGHSKLWRFIPPKYGLKFLSLLQKIQAAEFPGPKCSFYPVHKNLYVPDDVLTANNIPFVKIRQLPGTYVVTYPFAFHSGFSTGFSCAEAVNFTIGDENWPLYALHHFGCKKRICEYGENTLATPDNWIKSDNPHLYEQLKKGNVDSYHPEGFEIGHKTKLRLCDPKKSHAYNENVLQNYYCDPAHESLEISLRLRKIAISDSEEEYALINSLNVSDYIDANKETGWLKKIKKTREIPDQEIHDVFTTL